MTRKPKAVPYSDLESNERDQKEGNQRKPRAFDAPSEEELEDIFDTSTFAETLSQSEIVNHGPSTSGFFSWWGLFFGTLAALFLLVTGYQVQLLVDTFFEVHPFLGWLTTGLVAFLAIAIIVLIVRELLALARLRTLSKLRDKVRLALIEEKTVDKLILEIKSIYKTRPDMAWHIDRLNSYDEEVIDGADRIKLSEKCLMLPLDAEAKRIITATAKRVSIITALNPSPVLDILFVGFQILQMLRKIISLYGGRPGTLGAIKLARMVATHLAITGGLAVTDTFIQQFIGKGLAGRLSTKLGEGTVNGIMATRMGLAAIDLCRPIPFIEASQPNLTTFLSEFFSQSDKN